MSNTREIDMLKLDQLKERLLAKEKQYNTIASSYMYTQHALIRAQNTNQENTTNNDLLKQHSFFKENLESPETKQLVSEINALSKEIENLQIQVFGYENSDSPSALIKK